MDSHAHLHSLREYEVRVALDVLSQAGHGAGQALLEIGAGTGYQASQIARQGYRVEAIDLPVSHLAADRVWSVQDYDGRTIPFADKTFDVVFSSNVLEHIERLDDFQREIARVLKDDGVALHVVPSSAWRLWSCISHYAYLAKRVVAVGRKFAAEGAASGEAEFHRSYVVQRPLSSRIARMLLPGRHGERGNAFTEIAYFSAIWWRRRFVRTGWTVVLDRPVGHFYTGYDILGSFLSHAARRRVAIYAGSAARVFLLRKASVQRLLQVKDR